MNEQGPYTQSMPVSDVDPHRAWSRKDLGMSDPNRKFDRRNQEGYIDNPGRAMESSRKYAEGYRINDSDPLNTVNSRNGGRSRFANMTISEPAPVLDVTKPMA